MVSGSRTSEIGAELLSADVDDRRVTKDAKAIEVSTKNETEGKFSSVAEESGRKQESKGKEGTASIGHDHDSGMEGEFGRV